MDLNNLRKRAIKEGKTAALAGATLISLPFMLLFVLLVVGVAVGFYRDTRDHFFCDDNKRVQSDEMAIDVVQKSPEVKFFLENYPEVRASEDYVSGRRQIGSKGLWYVSRENKFPYNEVITVDFVYEFLDPDHKSLAITCSMGTCNPRPDCSLLRP